jgi:hypothetical protein
VKHNWSHRISPANKNVLNDKNWSSTAEISLNAKNTCVQRDHFVHESQDKGLFRIRCCSVLGWRVVSVREIFRANAPDRTAETPRASRLLRLVFKRYPEGRMRWNKSTRGPMLYHSCRISPAKATSSTASPGALSAGSGQHIEES